MALGRESGIRSDARALKRLVAMNFGCGSLVAMKLRMGRNGGWPQGKEKGDGVAPRLRSLCGRLWNGLQAVLVGRNL